MEPSAAPAEARPAGAPPAGHDLVVVSDLHLGRGYNPATRRWARLETFLADGDFLAFCRWLVKDAQERGTGFRLVLAGDVFDLLRIEPLVPPGAGGHERRYGPPLTPPVAAALVADILAGHREFVEGLVEVLAAGQGVVILPGNHDLETQHEPVREVVRAALRAGLARRGAAAALSGLRFESWFLHEPGRVWIEHGCQYDPDNAFRYHLRRRLPEGGLEREVAERDLPLGNFFQKYLYNAFGPITFIVPSSRANGRYFRWLLWHEPRLLAEVAWRQGMFLLRFLRRLAALPTGWEEAAARAHEEEREALAAASGLGARLAEVDALKARGADAARAAMGVVRQTAKLSAGAVTAGLAALAILATATAAIDVLQFGLGVRAALSFVLYLVGFAGATAALLYLLLRETRVAPDRSLREAAGQIAGLVEVPLVVFGHTHEERVAPLERPGATAWYYNTGTWIAVFTHDVLLPRERVQLTFLRVRGTDAELLHWSVARGRPAPAVLLEE